MKKRIFAILSLLLVAPYLMAPTGGFPSNPSFQNIGVGRPPTFGAVNTRVDIKAKTVAGYGEVVVFDTTTGAGAMCVSDTVGACEAGVPAHGLDFFVPSGFISMNGVTIVPRAGTFTATVSAGCTTTPSGTASYYAVGSMASIRFPSLTCTISGTPASVTISGMPATITPANTQSIANFFNNAGVEEIGKYNMSSGGSITANRTGGATFSGTFTISSLASVTYNLL